MLFPVYQMITVPGIKSALAPDSKVTNNLMIKNRKKKLTF